MIWILSINNFLFVLFILGLTFEHVYLIRNNKPIKHGLWAAIYLAVIGIFGIIFGWTTFFTGLFLRGWLYSIILNELRDKKWDYWSITSTSIIDKAERLVFRQFWIARLFYFSGWIVFIIIWIYDHR